MRSRAYGVGVPLVALALGMLMALASLPTQVSGQPQGKRKALPTEIRSVTMATGLWHPWSLAFLPNGDMLMTERNGKVRLMRDGKLDPEPIAGVPRVHSVRLSGLMEILLDPRFAQAYTMLACTHILDHANGWHDAGGKSLEKAHKLAQMAVARDADDPEAHWALGWTLLLRRQHDRAMAEVRTALRHDPNFALAHSLLGQVLYYSGRSAEALQPRPCAVQVRQLS